MLSPQKGDLSLSCFKSLVWLHKEIELGSTDCKADALTSGHCCVGECRWDFYQDKYLDFNIPMSIKNAEIIMKASENGSFELPMPKPKKLLKKGEKPPRFIEVFIGNLRDAKRFCEAMVPECRGIMEDKKNNRYLLRHGGAPRNFVITAQSHNDPSSKQYRFKKRNVYLRYCPGKMGFLQHYNKTLFVKQVNNKIKERYMYKFKGTFSVSAFYFRIVLGCGERRVGDGGPSKHSSKKRLLAAKKEKIFQKKTKF